MRTLLVDELRTGQTVAGPYVVLHVVERGPGCIRAARECGGSRFTGGELRPDIGVCVGAGCASDVGSGDVVAVEVRDA